MPIARLLRAGQLYHWPTRGRVRLKHRLRLMEPANLCALAKQKPMSYQAGGLLHQVSERGDAGQTVITTAIKEKGAPHREQQYLAIQQPPLSKHPYQHSNRILISYAD